jgi:protein arginine kinase activator
MTGLTDLEIPLVPKEQKICPGCGLSYKNIREKGKMGCGLCYQTFREYIIPLLERIHGKAHHSGKVPEKGKGQDERIKKIYDLRRKLEDAVRKEDYERAAELRDEIRELENRKKE